RESASGSCGSGRSRSCAPARKFVSSESSERPDKYRRETAEAVDVAPLPVSLGSLRSSLFLVSSSPMPALVPHVALTDAEFSAFRAERSAIPVDDAVFRIEGAGAIDCLQGLLTNDVVKPAKGTAIWGAFLTPKGMIITDAWVLRDERAAWILVPAAMRAAMQQLFARSIPPRLAKVT